MAVKECNFRIAKPLLLTIDEKWTEEAPKLSRESFIRSKIKTRLLQERSQYNRIEENGFKVKVGRKNFNIEFGDEPESFDRLTDVTVGENETEFVSFELTDRMLEWSKDCAKLSNALLALNESASLGLAPAPKFETVGEFIKSRIFIPTFQSIRDEEDKDTLDSELKSLDETLEKEKKAAQREKEKGIGADASRIAA